jgi:hypothetical protein
MNKIAWLGSFLLAICASFEAYRALTSDTYDISLPFIITWGLGELLLLINSLVRLRSERYLIFNYVMNLIFIGIILNRVI